MSGVRQPAIAAAGLRKSFGATTVLDGVDFSVAPGTVFALLGPNGSGKTTTVNILATLLSADAGEALVAGYDVAREADAVRDVIGVTGQFAAVDELLTGRENFDLRDAADRAAATYSGGMSRRLDLAMTLIGAPEIIFLDEPTTGLDPRSRRTMWEIVRGVVSDGTTVFLTTQYLEEADQLADRVAILDGGRLVAEGTPAELKAGIPGGHIGLTFADQGAYRAAADVLDAPARDEDSLALQVATDGNVATVWRVLRELDDAGIEVESLSIHMPDLDDVFLALTGRPAASEPEEVSR
jgi:ABC-2 type transport system ATP-binding protein